jgi:membrane fusion protein (multidrug efflux system)
MRDERIEGSAAPAAEKGARGRKRIIIPALLLVAAAVIIAVYWYVNVRGYVTTDDAYVDGDPITVSAKILGRVASLEVDEGDSLAAGQLVARLDDTDLRAQEAQAKANLEYVQQSVPVAKINMERARDDFDRAAMQFTGKIVSREQYDHARKALELTEAQYKVALSQVDATRAQLAVIETQLGNTKIFAPRTGVVARKWVVPGDIVQPGQPIFTAYDLGDVWVTANLEETKLGSIRVGDPVRLSVDALRGREFSGRVELIGAAAASQFSLIPPNNASGNFTKITQRIPVRISIEEASADSTLAPTRLLPGMSVEIKVRVKKA